MNFLTFDLGQTNVKIGHNINFGMPKKVFSLSFLKIDWVGVKLLKLLGPEFTVHI